jgi:xylulokinase
VVVVGIDIGTQSLKAVVVADGAVLGEAAVAYQADFPRPGWAEQDPRCWEDALAPAIGRALVAAGRAPSDVRGLGVAGQLDGCVAVDDRGAARGRCLIWLDRRAELPALPADFAAITGQVADGGHMAAKIRWLAAHAPGAARYHQPVSFVVERLTGAVVMDHALASTTMLYDLAAGAWSPALLAAFGVDASALPAIADATAVAGALHAAGAALTGLPAGIPVAVGTGDDFATPLGAGVIAPGRVACVVGTAEVVGALADQLVLDDGERLVETHAYPAGGWFVENPGWMSGGALTWLSAILGEADPAALDAAAAAVAPGADGLVFLPALSGAMAPGWRPGARGAFYGLTPAHGRGHLVRAVLEAMAHACRDVVDRLAALGLAIDDILLLGGGGQSPTWAQIRADVLGRRHVVAARGDTCAVGAAHLAAVAAGAVPDLQRAIAHAPPGAEVTVEPRAAHRAAHDDAHARYRALFAALDPMF